MISEGTQKRTLSFFVLFDSAVVPGIDPVYFFQAAAALTLPFDVVKTRRQIQLGEMDSLGGLCSHIRPLCSSVLKIAFSQEASSLTVSVRKTSSTLNILKEIWTELGYKGLFAGTHTFCPFNYEYFISLNTLTLINSYPLRFHAQSDQSGPSLCCYDKQLWVWKSFFSEGKPGSTAVGNLKIHQVWSSEMGQSILRSSVF